ncbi:MAG TPA: proteasome subunit alpha, partial [Pedococcus sp.]|nr:proteasome subunit alpha [Pedococcus sp.]
EVEIVVAEVGAGPDDDQIYRLTYDGSVADEHGFVAMGGAGEQIESALKERWRPGMSLADALSLAVELLGKDPAGGANRSLTPAQLEVAVLDRERPRRTFRRIGGTLLTALLNSEDPTRDAPTVDETAPGHHDTLTGETPRDAATNPQTQNPRAEEGPRG